MPPRRRTASPPPIDVDAIRSKVDEGRLVRVGIASSAQFPDGVVGRVRRVGHPAVDGEEFIFVEVAVAGVKDVLPFAVSDLTPAKRASASPTDPGKKAGSPAAGSRSAPAPAGAARRASGPARAPAAASASASASKNGTAPPAGHTTSDAPAAAGRGSPAAAGPRPDETGTASGARNSAAAAVPVSDALFDGDREPKPVISRADRARGRRPAVTITVSTTGEDAAPWRVEAKVGARVAVRATSVSPSRVWEIVQTLGDARLSAAVRSLLDDHRRVTQAKAEALAAELAAVQTELSLFPVEH